VTTAAYTLVAEETDLESILTELTTIDVKDIEQLAALAGAVRASLLAASMPGSVTVAITKAYRALGNGTLLPVAVRSSATAEDLPYASFAGQQDTYLNRVGIEAVLDAVKHCWASLWTDRAVSYRASLGIDHRTIRLAVAVQRMVDATVAGVLFTANPKKLEQATRVATGQFNLRAKSGVWERPVKTPHHRRRLFSYRL
jgi:pyruvate,water dikinase